MPMEKAHEELRDQGRAVTKEVLGTQYVENRDATTNEFNATRPAGSAKSLPMQASGRGEHWIAARVAWPIDEDPNNPRTEFQVPRDQRTRRRCPPARHIAADRRCRIVVDAL